MKVHWFLTAAPGENETSALAIADLGSGGYLILRAVRRAHRFAATLAVSEAGRTE